MFGLISKKKLTEAALEIYLENDTGKARGNDEESRLLSFYYNAGNANALNALCWRFGINLADIVKKEKERNG